MKGTPQSNNVLENVVGGVVVAVVDVGRAKVGAVISEGTCGLE